MSPKVQILVDGLNHHFGDGPGRKQVLFDNHLAIGAGELTVMTGPSGSGKTTLLTLIGALRTVQDGTLEVLGRNLSALSPAELVDFRAQLGFIFQMHNLFGSLSAIENVMLARDRGVANGGEKRQRGLELLDRLGLAGRVHAKPEKLSGGQRQRVAVARALVNHPLLILADEPTAALDKVASRNVVELLRARCRDDGATVIMVTHDNRILDAADRIVNMVDGRVVSDVVVDDTVALCELLSRSEVFQHLDAGTLTAMAGSLVREDLPGGHEVFRQGDAGDRFYLIRSGAVAVIADRGDGPREVARLAAGDFFGEAALLSGEPRNATIRVLEHSVLYWMEKETFLRVLENRDSLRDRLIKVVFQRQ